MTTNNHPAHGPVSLDRLHQISEILRKAAAQSDGGNLGYAMADAVKVIDVAIAAFNAEPVAYWRYAFRADGFCYADGINSKKHHDTNPLSQLSDGDYWRVTPLYAAPQSLNDAERAELQERRKADSEPVADVVVWSSPNEERTCDIRWRRFDVAPGPLYTAPQLVSERDQVRREHAAWSQATFGDVGPVGPLKHLSKEALEAAADPSDSLEWADMQFLLWDAQRRMGISDEFITRAMVEKLAINKSRQWPEPKDGEPRLHIKEKSELMHPEIEMLASVLRNAPLAPSDSQGKPRAPVVPDEMYWKDAPVEGSTRAAAYATGWNACRAAMLASALALNKGEH